MRQQGENSEVMPQQRGIFLIVLLVIGSVMVILGVWLSHLHYTDQVR
jgi:Tfp pilus assembly protein PilX